MKKSIISIGCILLLLTIVLCPTSISEKISEEKISKIGSFEDNLPPSLHTWSNNSWALVEKDYRFKACGVDPEGDQVWIHIVWGDGNVELFGPFDSEEEIIFTHKYYLEGNYQIRIDCFDEYHWFEFGSFVRLHAWIRDLEIKKISGGTRIQTTIKNNGNLDAVFIYWIEIYSRRNNALLSNDIISISANKQVTIETGLHYLDFHFGRVQVNLYSNFEYLAEIENGFLFGRFILI